MVHDVTTRVRGEANRRALEMQLRQAQRMQSLGTLAGGIAHDFNNILTAIAGYADIAKEELPPGTGTRECGGDSQSRSRRARELARQNLTIQPAGRTRATGMGRCRDRRRGDRAAPCDASRSVRIHTTHRRGNAVVSGRRDASASDADEPRHQRRSCGWGRKGTVDVRLRPSLVDSSLIGRDGCRAGGGRYLRDLGDR